MDKKAVHFGAGNIGRGFVAYFLHNSGYEVLNTKKSYKVIEVSSEGTREMIITNYKAINPRTHENDLIREIMSADVVTCAIGRDNLKFIAPIIARAIGMRSSDKIPATDALAANIEHPITTKKHRLDDHYKRARYSNCAIDRIVPTQHPDAELDVKLEEFYEWVIDRSPFADDAVPTISGVSKYTSGLTQWVYTVNTGHAAAAYYGFNRNKRLVHDALQDPFILDQVKKVLSNTSTLIIDKYGISKQDQEEVGRAPLRKLGRTERFIRPSSELVEKGYDCSALLDSVEMALRFQNARIIARQTPETVVAGVCGLLPSEMLYPQVLEIVKRVQADRLMA
ncbi:mannitol-1-phosphate 5-dehydrogenase [Fusarium redolens]|uniref:Mannitol-1-phosphate 5-dehydrogenase n=1 Tax=Fusarium redolens TaxID=48865 RepID=A0A9P9JP01_FUSRE|nr:mannitol-1-phosphate 5-dehydrogenase [Fusarium redolens]KAH7232182.1 mannitol-1-phosphate 5-dehydrogenase [Fusarium redolens]